MIERVIEFSAKNRFLVLLLVGFALLAGVWSIRNVPLDAIPDLSDVQVIIFTEWKGRSPNLVEDQITYPIVTAMLAAPKAKVVRGYSFFGLSFVYVLFEDNTDIYWARSRVLEYLNGIQGNLPDGVSPRLGPDATGVGWGFQYALVDKTGQTDIQQIRSFQDYYLRYWLQSVDGVSEVATVGGYEKQYQIEVDPNRLSAYDIPIGKVIAAVRKSNNDVGGRTLEFSGREYFIRGRGYVQSVNDLRKVVVHASPGGTPVLLQDVAKVHLGPDIRRGIAELDGEGEAVGGIVVVRFGENVLQVIDRVKQKLKEVESSLPPGVEVVTVYDRSALINRSIDNLKHTLLEESVIVAIVIIIFLLHFRSALVAILVLPIAVIISFIPFRFLGLTSNIMSLGGIAIAIGAMVDAACVLIENAHKRLEDAPPDADRIPIIIQAAKEVGKPIFFSLLVITVSFLPVFTLEAQEGRLFKPLAFTKTFAMFFAAVLSITLAPALMVLFIRTGRIWHETEHPISKRIQRWYYPWVSALMRRRTLSITIALIVVLSSVPIFFKLGSEFMPPLNEGDMLYMPTTLPGISVTEAAKVLQVQDRIIKQFPEVQTVFGKVGRSRTSTDPAPLSMVETTIRLKPEEEWRKVQRQRWYSSWAPEFLKKGLRRIWPEERPITWDELANELDNAMKLPGWTNAWTMPIKTRIDMLTTGIRTPIGIKVFGPDLGTIEDIGKKIEGILNDVHGTRSVYAERVTGGYFIDFTPDREAAARYGLTVEDVEQVVETAIGGMNIDTTVEGRERYTINVRYGRELRDDLEKLKRVLVPTPSGAQVPIIQLADLSVTTGPPVIKNEDGSLTGWIYVDVDTGAVDIGSYVEDAKAAVAERLEVPSGYYLKWTGQYEFMQRIAQKLKVVIPVTLLIIVVMLFLNFGSIGETLIVLLSIPFALTGSIWALYLLDYNLSIAVWVGMIALAGVAAETGIVMIVYLDQAYNQFKAEGRMNTQHDLFAAITYGAVQRVRPKLMTVVTTIMGLVPIMFSHGSGADVMQRIAAPMIGGLVSSTVLTLEIIPAIYSIYKQRTVSWAEDKPEPPSDSSGSETKGFAESLDAAE
ncbi:MAG: efflux RND transporter permease subunit [Armatimonadetes bacterium]|nr:efflux RND transporter permease subunit [Armatimonadota bacterium]